VELPIVIPLALLTFAASAVLSAWLATRHNDRMLERARRERDARPAE
jgi:membrane protein implicated in regulation of membrane protease activity